MPHPALNGHPSPNSNQRDNSTGEGHPPLEIFVNATSAPSEDGLVQDSDGPPLKKRKVAEDAGSHKSSPRASSPPWKKFTAEGPTSFLENGRRKSGRTNLIPLERQPHSGRRQTRAAYDKMVDTHARPSYTPEKRLKAKNKKLQTESKTNIPKRGPGRPPKVKTESPARHLSKISDTKILRRQSSRYARHNGYAPHPKGVKEEPSESDHTDESMGSLSPPLTFSKVKFRVALPKPAVTSPANMPQPRRFATFKEFLEQDPQEPFVGQDALSSEQILVEARTRHRVHEAQQFGLVRKNLANVSTIPERHGEPRRQYAHHDHLLAHISHFRALLKQEQKDHKKRAEQIAYEAKRYLEEKQRRGRVKTVEEIQQELLEFSRSSYRGVVKDLDKLWLSVGAEVHRVRMRQFEEEQQAKIKGHLNRVLERTDQMLQRQDESDVVTELDDISDETSDGEARDSDSEDLSESSSESDMEAGNDDPDAGLTAIELKTKYENLPDVEMDDDDGGIGAMINGVAKSMDTDTSDMDTEMDSEFDTSSSNEDEDDGEEEVSDSDQGGSDDGVGGGLMSLFFSKKQIAKLRADSTAATEPGAGDVEGHLVNGGATETSPVKINDQPVDEELINPHPIQPVSEASASPVGLHKTMDDHKAESTNHVSQLPAPDNTSMTESHSGRMSPQTSTTKTTEFDSTSSLEPPHHGTPTCTSAIEDKSTTIKTPVPSLLRGTLREYQHEGLDWLANLYAQGRSGILADEMGLGKTIQSISLLAHLATEYEVWGPHLIVVPTSVMLNWEMEFKKFLPGFKILTYYGSLEERKQKRRGWMTDDSFNVCITSYQLVLQDANSFKRRRWHYMILDEAHNIKNFRSERWQTMMTFNTRARLLLTGTPLQNNLTELWSLLFFLHYGQEGQDNDDAFAGLKEWSEWFKRPVESILEHGKQTLDAEDQEQVSKLHKVIRPYLLRRLKADVEKQMPAKYEHVEMCRLSKRQRQLYDGFMSRAQTKETLASGNYLSIINALMQLRKVCNHPDLFETRPINTSFAMQKSVVADFEIQDLLIRRKLFGTNPLEEVDLDFLQLVPISNERISTIENLQTLRRHAYGPIKSLRDSQWSRIKRQAVASYHSCSGVINALDTVGRRARLQDLDRTVYYEAYRHHQRPIYGRGLLQKLFVDVKRERLSRLAEQNPLSRNWECDPPLASLGLVQSIADRSEHVEPLIQHFACLTPAVVAMNLNSAMVSEPAERLMYSDLVRTPDPFHQARMKMSIAFPDKRLLQYDCGKLQRLDKLLRELQAGGHRALIFTQMTKVLDILEQFLNIHGHRYLRLDGATKIEQRQILTDRFNNDTRILAFILSSRSGGLGINLTGADTVIFYDLDWNPAMDKQCTDRAHRIGQTRDVHIYRFVSEHTIESNILRKANQKQLLDDVVIQEGDFTTDYLNRTTYRDMLDDQQEDDVAGAAMDRVLGNDKTAVAAFERAEDHEDVSAAKVATKEVQIADDGDFEDNATAAHQPEESTIPGPIGSANAALAAVNDDGIHHIDDYLLKLQTYLLRDVPLVLPKDKTKKGRRREDHRRRRL